VTERWSASARGIEWSKSLAENDDPSTKWRRWFPEGGLERNALQSRGVPRNCTRRVDRHQATGATWEGGDWHRPVSQETCHHGGGVRLGQDVFVAAPGGVSWHVGLASRQALFGCADRVPESGVGAVLQGGLGRLIKLPGAAG